VDILVWSQQGISIFEFPERFLEISCKDLTSFTSLSNLLLNKLIGATPQRHFFGGEGGAWYEKGVTLRGLRISEKKEILCKLTVL
jgi:hypothetical protein